MAGSLSHIVRPEGFSMQLLDGMRDAREALEECYYIICELSGGDRSKVNAVCDKLGFPEIKADMRPIPPRPGPLPTESVTLPVLSVEQLEELVNRFLRWKLPTTVNPDGVNGDPNRSGTNLLTADEARQMFKALFKP